MTLERRPRLRLALAAAALLSAGTARAGEESGLSLGARVGYRIPVGDAMAGVSLSDVVSGQVPLRLDAAWRFDPTWRLGLYGEYGFATIAGAFCPPGAGCSGRSWRLGVQAAYAFDARGTGPWVGAGLGLEWQQATVTSSGVKNELRLLGVEILDLQAGLDFRPSPAVALGPFVSAGLGQFRTATSGGVSLSLATALHGWLQIGARGSFDL